nr:PLD nuclease N-terminal domain-containing protein [Microbacterium amylolyticum]
MSVAAVVFTIFAIVDCATQPETRHRGVPKGAWVVITLVPVIGGILWLTIGRARKGQQPPSRPVAPDDNPGFLTAADERIRQIEEELAMLDAEEQFNAPSAEKPGDGDDEVDEDDDDGQSPVRN